MTLFFPDVNVWLALSDESHAHSAEAWCWFSGLDAGATVFFSRYTQLAFLRLVTNEAVLGRAALTLAEAWAAWDRWLEDPRVEYRDEGKGLSEEFRAALLPFGQRKAWKWVGDGFILAQAKHFQATLVTFDRALEKEALRQHCRTIRPAD